MKPKRIGILGFGHLGEYLAKAIEETDGLDVAFVWNRDLKKLRGKVQEHLVCRDLDGFSQFSPDLVVEVAHPAVSEKYGPQILGVCDYLVGSPTALASKPLEECLRKAASTHGLYIPAGALWGGQDIAKMSQSGSLTGLKITMRKHPSCFRLESELKLKNEQVTTSPVVLYEGPVRALCPLAPNNVNTMAAAAIGAQSLGFDGVQGCLVADPGLREWHIVETEVTGPTVNGNPFTVYTIRKNPADSGVVTGSATYGAFLSSIKRAGGLGPGVHLC